MRQWKETTRGGYWVRGIEPVDSEGSHYELRGEVGNHSNEPPSEDPADWTRETWRSDGRYLVEKESSMDLIEVQMEPTLSSDEIQVWYVRPNKQGEDNEIVSDNRDEAEDYARHVLSNLFDDLDDDCEKTVTIRRGKMLRSKYESLEDC